MDTQRREGMEAEGYGDESLNTSSTSGNEHQEGSEHHRKSGIHNNALYAASMGRPATAQVDPHNTRDLANTGTNVSYEGPTAPGAGGSEGTGFTSGQPGTTATIATSSDYDQAAIGKHFDKAEGEDDIADEAEDEMNEQR
jgi:hypothetical protein